jgi:hypothetical protein
VTLKQLIGSFEKTTPVAPNANIKPPKRHILWNSKEKLGEGVVEHLERFDFGLADKIFAKHPTGQSDFQYQSLQNKYRERFEVEAKLWYRAIADNSDAPIVSSLSIGDEQAAAWFQKAAEQGDAEAQNVVGELLWYGRGVEKDDIQAVSWFRLAAEQGLADAQNNLGILYENGMGISKDIQRAMTWYKKAAEQGHEDARANLMALIPPTPSKPESKVFARPESGRRITDVCDAKCPKCGADALEKSLFSEDYYCFPSRGGCGAVFPNLTITASGLTRGRAIEPYYGNSERSTFGNVVNKLKYWSISADEKIEMIDWVVKSIKERGIIEDLVGSVPNKALLVVPVPSSKKRDIQHVYEIAKRIAAPDYQYAEALRKNTAVESKTLNRGIDYSDSDFTCVGSVKGWTVLIIDDTYGEGATLRAIIREMKKNGVEKIYFLSLCKNTRGGIKQPSNPIEYYNVNEDIPF